MAQKVCFLGAVRRRTFICCRNIQISTWSAARDRNRSATIQTMSLTRSLITQQHRPILDQLLVRLSLRQGQLVYDVSRWGRFQDVDESAHYEFVCKLAGIKVVYCAELFDNDGSMLSCIVKNLKRVMASEYSRELSAKVHAGACRVSRVGFRLGGSVGRALARELVDEKLQPKGIIKDGDRKYLTTDHVRRDPVRRTKSL
jgi:DNA invertase Pin-like site-specific DNA recombinase